MKDYNLVLYNDRWTALYCSSIVSLVVQNMYSRLQIRSTPDLWYYGTMFCSKTGLPPTVLSWEPAPIFTFSESCCGSSGSLELERIRSPTLGPAWRLSRRWRNHLGTQTLPRSKVGYATLEFMALALARENKSCDVVLCTVARLNWFTHCFTEFPRVLPLQHIRKFRVSPSQSCLWCTFHPVSWLLSLWNIKNLLYPLRSCSERSVVWKILLVLNIYNPRTMM